VIVDQFGLLGGLQPSALAKLTADLLVGCFEVRSRGSAQELNGVLQRPDSDDLFVGRLGVVRNQESTARTGFGAQSQLQRNVADLGHAAIRE